MSQAGTTTMSAPKRASLMPLWILLAVFAIPSIAAWWFFLNPEYLPDTRKNYGELLEPVLPMHEGFELRDPQGRPFDVAKLSGNWVLVTVSRGVCDADCLDRLIAMRQIRLAVGENRFVVDRLLLTTEPEAVSALAADLPGMHVAVIDEARLRALQDDLPAESAPASQFFLMDPMGQLMMRYAEDAPHEHLLRDLEHVLKATRGWIKGAASHDNR